METRINASPEWGRPLWIVRSGPVRGGVAPQRHQTEAAIPTLPGARAVTAAARANSDPRGTPARTLAGGHFPRLRARIGDQGPKARRRGKCRAGWAAPRELCPPATYVRAGQGQWTALRHPLQGPSTGNAKPRR